MWLTLYHITECTASIPSQRFGARFEAVLVDTGAALRCSSGSAQYQANCRYVGKKPIIDETRAATCHFSIGSVKSFGMTSESFPIGPLWFSYNVHVVEADTFMILSIDDMGR